MNFSPETKAWILLVCLIVSSGGAVSLTSYMGGAKWQIALIGGLITAATNVYHALAASPKDKAASASAAPFAPKPPSS